MTKRETVPYLRFGGKRIAFLMLLATGKDRQQIADEIAVPIRTIESWFKDQDFRHAEQAILEDPLWFHVNIATPLAIAGQDAAMLADFLLHGKPMQRVNGKVRELMLQELNLIGVEDTSSPTDKLLEMLGNVRFQAQPKALHTVEGEVLDV